MKNIFKKIEFQKIWLGKFPAVRTPTAEILGGEKSHGKNSRRRKFPVAKIPGGESSHGENSAHQIKSIYDIAFILNLLDICEFEYFWSLILIVNKIITFPQKFSMVTAYYLNIFVATYSTIHYYVLGSATIRHSNKPRKPTSLVRDSFSQSVGRRFNSRPR